MKQYWNYTFFYIILYDNCNLIRDLVAIRESNLSFYVRFGFNKIYQIFILNYNQITICWKQQYELIFLFMLFCRLFICTIKKMRAFNGTMFVGDGWDWNVKFSTLFRHGTTVWLFVAYLFRAYKYFILRIPFGGAAFLKFSGAS